MAASLTASFILKLEDQLSSGIVALSRKLEALAALGRKVQLAGLDGADRALDKLGASADRAGRKVDGIGASARSAMAELRRLSSQPIMINAAGTAFLPPGVSRTTMAATTAGAGGGGGRVPALRDAPFMEGGPPLLTGPGGGQGGIPLNYNPGPGGGQGGIPLNYNPRAGRFGWPKPGGPRVGENMGLMETGLAALTLEAPIRAAAELDKVLRQVAIIGTLSGKGAEAEIGRLHSMLEKESIETGQPIVRLAEAYRDLRNRGLSSETVDRLLPIHGRAATAYGVDTESMGQAVSALNKNLGIGEADMPGALAAMAQATHEGTFGMAAMSHYMPTITGRMSMLGMKGRGSLDKVAAALEVVSASSGDPNQTATNFTDMMIAMTQPYAKKAFKKVGIDLVGEMTAAEQAGKDPMETYIGILKRMTQGIKGDVAKAFYLGKVLHNQQAGTAALALVQHEQEYLKLRDELDKIKADKLDRDYRTAQSGLSPQRQERAAKASALEQRLGKNFAWTVPVESALLGGVVSGLSWMEEHFPVLTKLALGLGGGLLAMAVALGTLLSLEKILGPRFLGIGRVILVLRGAFSLLGSGVVWLARGLATLVIGGGPLVWILVAIAAAAVLIWRNWDKIGPLFWRLWGVVKAAFVQFWHWLTGWIDGAMQGSIAAIKQAWSGLGSFFSGLWGGVTDSFNAVLTGIEDRIERMRGALGLGGTPPVQPPPLSTDEQRQTGTGMFTPSSFSGGRVGFDPIEIRVTTDGNAKVEAPKRLMPIDRGEMLGRA